MSSQMSIDEQHQDEYENRVYYWHTTFKGKAVLKDNVFHPWIFKGTEKEYESKTDMYMNHDYGKIIGTYKYDTMEEFDKYWSKPKNKR